MLQKVSLAYKWLSIGLFCMILLLSTNFLTAGQAHAASAGSKSTNEDIYTVCVPKGTNEHTAFPYSSTISSGLKSQIPQCGASFDWGYTTAGSATGQAEWDDHNVGVPSECQAQAFIPDNHAGAPGAQYFLYDGSHYLANFTMNQNKATGWTDLYSQTFHVTNYMRVTLSDHDDTGAGGWNIAAYAVSFDCIYD